MLFDARHSPEMPFFLGFGTTKDSTDGINVAVKALDSSCKYAAKPMDENDSLHLVRAWRCSGSCVRERWRERNVHSQ
jgi:hypothetical protein